MKKTRTKKHVRGEYKDAYETGFETQRVADGDRIIFSRTTIARRTLTIITRDNDVFSRDHDE